MSRLKPRPVWAALLVWAVTTISQGADRPRIMLERTAHGGIQPQVTVDDHGGVHLVYYAGDPRRGDLFYVRRERGQGMFTPPIPVNSSSGNAMAIGSIRGAQVAVGKGNRIHVVWNGGDGTRATSHEGVPLLYTRLKDDLSGFEKERDLISYAAGLDGGSSVAADSEGRVYVAWHASRPGNTNGEAGRAVFVARSLDEGQTFSREQPALEEATGACACCGMHALANEDGTVYLLFRAASQSTNRSELLLVSRDAAKTFQIANSDPWVTPTCPMSSAFLTAGRQQALAAWETSGQVWFSRLGADGKVSSPLAPPGQGKRKHPVAVQNQAGDILLVWTEGTGWEKGGAVAWQLFNRQGVPQAERGKVDGVPVWSFAAAFPTQENGFVIVY